MDVSTGHEELIFLESVFVPKIWGGSRLRELHGHPTSGDRIGECIVISGHPSADCRVRGGRLNGMALSALWSEHRHLFGDLPGASFPLQIKFIDALEDLSVQVHPDAAYARTHDTGEEKNECWYVLAASHSRRIVIGHTARTRGDLSRLAGEGRWDDLLRRTEMNEGDFYFIPAGTAHCILAGSLIYEVMQSSDTTYRLYDYDRVDTSGAKRDLHFEEAMAALKVPDAPVHQAPSTVMRGDGRETLYIRNQFFCVRKWEVAGRLSFVVEEPFLMMTALEGSGYINEAPVVKGDHFIIPNAARVLDVVGPLTLMVTSP